MDDHTLLWTAIVVLVVAVSGIGCWLLKGALQRHARRDDRRDDRDARRADPKL